MKNIAILTAAMFLALMAVAVFPTKMTPYRHYIAHQWNMPGMVSPPKIDGGVAVFYYEDQKIVILDQGDKINPLVKAVPY